MYSRQYFIEQFRETDTAELIDRYISSDLTDAAKDAIHAVLRERGISDKDIVPLVRQAKKAKYRIAGITNHCDYCGKSVLFFVSRVKSDGQKFCNNTCLRNARLMEISVDIPEQNIRAYAVELKNGVCPSCRKRESKIEVRKFYWVWSAILYTHWGTSSKVCCRKCGIKSNLISMLSSLCFGWWGIPWGFIITPIQIISNIAELFRPINMSDPSDDLIQVARLRLAESLLPQQTISASS